MSIGRVVMYYSVILSFLLPGTMAYAGGGTDVGPLSWKKADLDLTPGVRICGLMVYDSESDVVLLYGGFDLTEGSPELWAFDYEEGAWKLMNPSGPPPGRFGHGWIYDPARDICLMFFGISGENYFNDTWQYDYNSNTWTELRPAHSPTPRCKGGSAFDTESDQVIFFGGFGNDTVNLDETWTYNYDENIWVNRTVDKAPQPRMRCPMIYAEEHDRVILFGGWLGGTEVLGDTWAYDFDMNTWEEMNPPSSPAARARYGRSYIPSTGEVLITHGWGGDNGDYNDTWVYDYSRDRWKEMNILGPTMDPRHCFQMALDTQSGIIVAQGGSGEGSFDDTWLLNPYPEEQEAEGTNIGAMIAVIIIIVIAIIIVVIIIRQSRHE
ncbi:MAG: kelch repeat-containing protein [Thermoplasmatota archaeon]